MTTIEEFRITVEEINTRTLALSNAVNALKTQVTQVKNLISANNEFSGVIDVDALINIQSPIYANLLANIETAIDAF